jgi:biopolymer transport protein ExbB
MKKLMLLVGIMSIVCGCVVFSSLYAQDAMSVSGPGDLVATEAAVSTAASSGASRTSFIHVVFASGPLGVLLWLAIFGASGAGVYFAVDCAITVRTTRIMPPMLISTVNEAMAEGDVLKALQNCEREPGPMANILTAGFSHVEEGFDVIQDAISTAADLETEQILQKLTWLSVVGNLAPMLGLLGTVQGMIRAFSTLAMGAPDVGELAEAISQALYTTAAGLTIAVPCVAVFYVFRNAANKIVLKMEAMTTELIKDLRNVEVVEE